MPSKRVIAHTMCTGCGRPLQLQGLVASVDCPWCRRRELLEPAAWQCVLAEGERTIMAGQRVLGETRASSVCCTKCQAQVDDAAITAALSAGAPIIVCPSCSHHLWLAPLPAGAARPGPWRESHCSAVVGSTEPGEARLAVPCSNCGAPMQVDGTTNEPTCAYCGARNQLSPEAQRELDARRVPTFYVWTSPQDARAAARRTRRRTTLVFASIAGVVVFATVVVGVLFAPRLLARKPPPPPPPPAAAMGRVGAPCNGLTWACTADGKRELHCEGARFVVANVCAGPKGCTTRDNGNTVHCDRTLANVHDPCDEKNFLTCSSGHHSIVRCDGSQWEVYVTCRGPDGCREKPESHGKVRLLCDSFIAKAGDPCNRKHGIACSPTHDALFSCVNGQYRIKATCRGAKGCRMSHDRVSGMTTVHCDTSLGHVGDACFKGDYACSSDQKDLLHCPAGGHYQAVKKCPHGCVPKGGHAVCR